LMMLKKAIIIGKSIMLTWIFPGVVFGFSNNIILSR